METNTQRGKKQKKKKNVQKIHFCDKQYTYTIRLSQISVLFIVTFLSRTVLGLFMFLFFWQTPC
jgi:hypothetical protein